MWIERRKGSSTSTEEENEPLSDGSKTLSDCEKGITDTSKNKNRNVDNCVICPLSTGPCEILLTTYRFAYPSTSTIERKHRCLGRVQRRRIPQVMTGRPVSPVAEVQGQGPPDFTFRPVFPVQLARTALGIGARDQAETTTRIRAFMISKIPTFFYRRFRRNGGQKEVAGVQNLDPAKGAGKAQEMADRERTRAKRASSDVSAIGLGSSGPFLIWFTRLSLDTSRKRKMSGR